MMKLTRPSPPSPLAPQEPVVPFAVPAAPKPMPLPTVASPTAGLKRKLADEYAHVAVTFKNLHEVRLVGPSKHARQGWVCQCAGCGQLCIGKEGNVAHWDAKHRDARLVYRACPPY